MPSFCTYFISDLHLQPDRPDITKRFREFMQTQACFADALYILGDLFEYWVGDSLDSGFNQSIYAEIQSITQQGIPVYFMRGNRDYLISKKFARMTGTTLIKDPTLITLYGQRYLLSHGDQLCIADKNYQCFRRIMHSKIAKFITMTIPEKIRERTVIRMREKSKQYNKKTDPTILDVQQAAVEKLLKKHNAHYLIHGHTHRPDTHRFVLDGKPCTRIVLGSWEEKIEYLKIEPDQTL